MQETQVRSLGQEDPLEESMATHSSILLGEFHGWGAWRATVHGVTKSQTRLKRPSTHTHHTKLIFLLTNIITDNTNLLTFRETRYQMKVLYLMLMNLKRCSYGSNLQPELAFIS